MPLLYEDTIRREWIDYNGHMSEAFYVLVFGYATDVFLDAIGLDEQYRTEKNVSAFTVEAHIRYLDQGLLGEPLHVSTLLTDCGTKKVRIFHTMRRGAHGAVLATEEILLLHVDTATEKVRPFDTPVVQKLQELAAEHSREERPADLGRSIRI
ncbi:MAG: thioesterase family protein [Desulfopila sp.]